MLVLPLPPLQRMPIILVKLYTYQMLRALAHIHSIGVCHRWGQRRLLGSQGAVAMVRQGRPLCTLDQLGRAC